MWTWEVFQIDNTKATPNFIIKLLLSLKCKAWVKQHTLYYPIMKDKWCHGPSNYPIKNIIMFIFFIHSQARMTPIACGWHPLILLINMKPFTYATHATFWLIHTQCWPKMLDELHPHFRSKTSWKSIPFKSRLNSYHWLQLFIIIIVEHSGLKSKSSCFWKHEQTLSQAKHN